MFKKSSNLIVLVLICDFLVDLLTKSSKEAHLINNVDFYYLLKTILKNNKALFIVLLIKYFKKAVIIPVLILITTIVIKTTDYSVYEITTINYGFYWYFFILLFDNYINLFSFVFNITNIALVTILTINNSDNVTLARKVILYTFYDFIHSGVE